MTYGVLNLTHRDSHEFPEALEPGKTYRVRIQLNDMAQNVPAGHRIRIALSNSMWPLFWPSPEPVTVTLATGISTLTLPTRTPRDSDASLPSFGPPESARPWETITLEPGDYQRRVEHDDTTGDAAVIVVNDSGLTRDPATDWEFGSRVEQRFSITEGRSGIRTNRDPVELPVPTTVRELLHPDRDPINPGLHQGRLVVLG